MAMLIQIECDVCRFVPDSVAVPYTKGRLRSGYIRDVAKQLGWQCTRRRDGHWRYYCPECIADLGKEKRNG